ncbi:DNA-dependent metalloprotease SPRTN isoform X2 [Dipodomys spectabilis]|uniref:DNA-dependent metalloprotease SPRTN isoform X2 n=1 Tax=Dipodomys spectabilis TaxID=105255 RepID=UPI001C54BC85|nr:DNA-dependent metalloprotease SPRTN isoform X2 [Dipodomys spectabilis]
MDEDLVVALRLQREWDARAAQREWDARAAQREAAREPPSLVDASWELADPTPDLQALFVQFNDRFFWGQLEAVEVKWSARMTLCAGICLYEGRGGMCSIRLSEPLLKLRPRKDLVETLLHEMIHAYLFVTDNDKDREGHGPEFCKHMRRINNLTGANITIYHSFHDEVEEYRRHWWRCDGPCQYRQPYYGYVKRSTNRAPSCHDYWWAEHQKTCGGTFIKVKEPENYSRKGKRKGKVDQQPGSAVENKGKRGRAALPLVPFSGKGYVLGETRPLPAVGTPTTSRTICEEASGHSSLDRTADVRRPDPGTHVRVELDHGDSSSGASQLATPLPSATFQSVLSSYFPQKAFRSVPVPTPSLKSGASAATPRTPRNPSKAGPSASVAVSQKGRGGEDLPFTNKRPRLEAKTAFDHFFIKKEQVPRGPGDAERSWSPGASTLAASHSCGQSPVVSCPVCQEDVAETQINEHLDLCLEGTAGRSEATGSEMGRGSPWPEVL